MLLSGHPPACLENRKGSWYFHYSDVHTMHHLDTELARLCHLDSTEFSCWKQLDLDTDLEGCSGRMGLALYCQSGTNYPAHAVLTFLTSRL